MCDWCGKKIKLALTPWLKRQDCSNTKNDYFKSICVEKNISILTRWGLVMHKCVSDCVIIGSGDCFLPVWQLAIISIDDSGTGGAHWYRTNDMLVDRMSHTLCDIELWMWPWPCIFKAKVIWQTTFSNVFSWMKTFKFLFQFHWNLFPRVQFAMNQHWFR